MLDSFLVFNVGRTANLYFTSQSTKWDECTFNKLTFIMTLWMLALKKSYTLVLISKLVTHKSTAQTIALFSITETRIVAEDGEIESKTCPHKLKR